MNSATALRKEVREPIFDTFDSVRAMRLAGTVSIPSPYPEPGRITLGRLPLPGGTSAPAPEMLRIEHRQSHLLQIVRTIRRADVQALFIADHPDNPEELRQRWLLDDESLEHLLETPATRNGNYRKGSAGGTSAGPALIGTVFVKEHASVLMEVQIGMTAAESVEYYPPTTMVRSDAHYDPSAMACHGPRPCR